MKARVILLLIIALFFAGCCKCGVTARKQNTDPARDKVISMIKAKTGNSFYSEHFSFLSAASFPDAKSTEFSFAYNPRLEGAEAVKLVFTLDSAGALMNTAIMDEVPRFSENPNAFAFKVTEKQARDIAKTANFPEGIKPWQTSFHFDTQSGQYLWRVRSVSTESEGSNGYRGRGRFLFLSPLNGAIIRQEEWNVR